MGLKFNCLIEEAEERKIKIRPIMGLKLLPPLSRYFCNAY